MKPTTYRLTGLANGRALRTATYHGREHLVVPVVMLSGDIVIRPLGSLGPEYVPGEVLAVNPEAWDGRPLLPEHPLVGTVSGLDPVTLETMSFGQIFNTRYIAETKQLVTEAWIDLTRAENDPAAASVVARCRAGEAVEVSVCAWTQLRAEAGITPSGVAYEYRWSAPPNPAHLAMFKEGEVGACSVQMGCGTQQLIAAKAALDIQLPPEIVMPKPATTGLVGLFNRALAAMLPRAAAGDTSGTSDNALRYSLGEALRAAVPGFDWVVDVYPDTSTVVYCAHPADEWIYYTRTYAMSGTDVSLNADEVQVESQTSWVPVAAGGIIDTAPTSLKAACSCTDGEGGGNSTVAPTAATTTTSNTLENGDPMSKVTDLAGRLIAAKATPFTEAHRAHLEAMGEDVLDAMVKPLDAEEPKTSEPTAPTPPTPPPPPTPTALGAQLTEEQFLATAPQSVRDVIARAKAADSAHRTSLISALAEPAKGVFTPEQLAAKSTDDLVSLAALAKLQTVPDAANPYAGLGMPLTAAAGDEYPKAPDPYNLAGLAAARANGAAK